MEDEDDEDFYPDLAATLKKPVKVLPEQEEEEEKKPALRGKVELIVDEEALRINSELTTPKAPPTSIVQKPIEEPARVEESSLIEELHSNRKEESSKVEVLEQVSVAPAKPVSKTLELIKKITSQATDEEAL